ncbi:MAG: PIN domain-containing protein [Gemmatimonadota bacterium]
MSGATMIALDTNVLLRHLYTADDPNQSALASALIEEARGRGETVYLSGIVLCELVWTLRSAFDLPRSDVLAVLQRILTERQNPAEVASPALFVIPDWDLVQQAIDDYASGQADFADYLIGRLAHDAGVTTTYTFDQKAAAAPTFKHVRAG